MSPQVNSTYRFARPPSHVDIFWSVFCMTTEDKWFFPASLILISLLDGVRRVQLSKRRLLVIVCILRILSCVRRGSPIASITRSAVREWPNQATSAGSLLLPLQTPDATKSSGVFKRGGGWCLCVSYGRRKLSPGNSVLSFVL